MSLADDVQQTLDELDLTPRDHAAAALALRLASEIDAVPEPADLARFSAQLAALLAELGATPASRARISSHQKPGQQPTGAPVDALAEFRKRQTDRRAGSGTSPRDN